MDKSGLPWHKHENIATGISNSPEKLFDTDDLVLIATTTPNILGQKIIVVEDYRIEGHKTIIQSEAHPPCGELPWLYDYHIVSSIEGAVYHASNFVSCATYFVRKKEEVVINILKNAQNGVVIGELLEASDW